jgi:hypothetical protein
VPETLGVFIRNRRISAVQKMEKSIKIKYSEKKTDGWGEYSGATFEMSRAERAENKGIR